MKLKGTKIRNLACTFVCVHSDGAQNHSGTTADSCLYPILFPNHIWQSDRGDGGRNNKGSNWIREKNTETERLE